ncbi:MAG: cytochrome c [Anaerolineae bacterium]
MISAVRRSSPLLFAVGVLGLVLALTACQGLAGEPRIVGEASDSSSSSSNLDLSNADQDIAAVMTLGGEVWGSVCADCHGRMGEGTQRGAPLPDLTNLSDAEILAAVTNGVPDNGRGEMPAFGDDLTSDQLNAAATYARMMSQAITSGMVSQPISTEEASASGDLSAPVSTEEAAVLGTVSGTVTNGTGGASVPSDLTVTLHIIKSEIEEETFDTGLDANNSFQIEGVPFVEGYSYVMTVPYGNIMYVSEIATGDPASPAITLPVTIYEEGAPADAVQITMINAQVMSLDNTIQVVEIINFVNTSDRVYLNLDTPEGASVHVNLPGGAQFLSTTSSHNTLSDDGTLMFDDRPLLPSRSLLVHASFAMPYSGNAAIEQGFDYPINGPVNIIAGTDGLSISGEGLTQLDPVTSSGRTLQAFGGTFNTTAGTPFRFTVSGTPIVTNTTTSTGTIVQSSQVSPIAYVLIGAGVSALVFAAVLAIRDRSMKSDSNNSAPAAPADDKTRIAQLMEEIAELDSLQAAGKVDAREYSEKRAALKKELSALMKSQ